MRILMIALLCAAAHAQPYLNLDFETVSRGRVRGWPISIPGFEIASDTEQKVSGARSLRIRNTGASDTTLVSSAFLLPLDQIRGKRVKISGHIRTDGVSSPTGYSAIWLRADGPDGVLTLDNMSATGPRGTTEWTRYEYERVIPEAARQVIFGVFQVGRGTTWWDDLRIDVDGRPLVQGPEPYVGEPTAAQIDWIKRNSFPFDSPDAGTGFADLQPLKAIVGNARVVGMGEATHGTREFFRMKHRLMEFLATEMGFTIFNIEANMPESYRVNDYVLTGRGDPKALLRGMYFWTWNTQEVLDMIEWMRLFNASGKGRVQFTGNDMQTGTVARQIVTDFVRTAEPGYLPLVEAAYRRVRDVESLPSNPQTIDAHWSAAWAAFTVRDHLETKFKDYLGRSTVAEADWAVQNARVAEQAAYVKIGGGLHRDEMMALNLRWTLERNPGAKLALWAHNYHVSRLAGAQGSHLAQWYGAEYSVLGFAFGEGRYNALALLPNGAFGPLQANTAVTPFPGSAEYMLRAARMPRFILDLRRAAPDNDGAWIVAGPEFREHGAVAGDGFTVRNTLTKDFDALIYFDQTGPSVLLPF